jgi:kojibiose phosphorylase
MLFYLFRQGAFVDSPHSRQAIAPLNLNLTITQALSNIDALEVNWNYYNPRTDHTYGSSLSPAIHAILACQMGKVDEAYKHFMRSALVDLADVRSNAAEGIHAASAGGVWQAIIFGFAGIQFTENGPVATPRLPQGWTQLKFKLQWQGQTYDFDLQPAERVQTRPTHLPIQAVIFDLDGVITDTSEFHYQAWQRLADEAGLPFDRSLNESLRGISRRDSLLRLLHGRQVTDAQFQEMMDRKNGYYLDLIHTITPDHLLPGVGELLADLKVAGVKIALGSSSKNAPEVLERLGIAGLMDEIADGNSVTQSKPAPDVFLFAAKQLGIAPEHCLVIEDATSGIEAAIRAGMRSIGLGPVDRLKEAQLVFPSLDGVRWADILIKLDQRTKPAQTVLTIQRLLQHKGAYASTKAVS